MMRSVALVPIFALLALGGCSDRTGAPAASLASLSAPRPENVSNSQLIGSWGVASYHSEKDRERTEGIARSQCKLPYKITRGPTDGVMMHVADDATTHELRLKAGPGGKTYLGFEAPVGDPQDREVLAATGDKLVMRFINAETDSRYGTYVYIRCSSQRA